jgi:hypothetical protein
MHSKTKNDLAQKTAKIARLEDELRHLRQRPRALMFRYLHLMPAS